MGEVVDFGGPTTLGIPPEKILAGAMGAKLVMCLVIGETEDGEIYSSTSTGDLAEIILALELAKAAFLKQVLG